MKIKCDLSAEYVRTLLRYDAGEGRLFWLVDRHQRIKKGDEAGKPTRDDKYPSVRIDGELYLAHRIAWLIIKGEWPTGRLDHRDRVKTNYKLKNLRPATQSQNMQNATLRSDNKSGAKGVSWDEINKKWVARIREHKGKFHNLGRFDSVEEASRAYTEKSAVLFGEFARLR